MVLTFQNNIQQNKDWNELTAMETTKELHFQNNIQQNKDWN